MLLIDLVRRFVELEPRSGMVLAEVVVDALGDGARRGQRASAIRLLARARFRCGDHVHAEAAFQRAREIAEQAGDMEMERSVLSELWPLQAEREDASGAELTLRRSAELATRAGDRDQELFDRANLTALLLTRAARSRPTARRSRSRAR